MADGPRAGDPVDATKRRPEARDSAPIGSAHGLHMPGILPEPDVIAADGEELTEGEKEVLRDLHDALPEEDRAPPEPEGGAAEAAAPVDLPRQRAELPWWYGVFFFVFAGVSLLLAAGLAAGVGFGVRLAFAAAGLVAGGLAVKAWRARPSGGTSDAVAGAR